MDKTYWTYSYMNFYSIVHKKKKNYEPFESLKIIIFNKNPTSPMLMLLILNVISKIVAHVTL